MRVPLLDLKLQHEPLRAEILEAIEGVMATSQFILGPAVARFESALAGYSGCAHAVGVTSGSDALLAALMALRTGPGDEVVTTAYSFFATAGAVSRLGATPVLADIDPVTYNLQPAAAEAAMTPRTKAVIPVHLYGQCADMDPILAAARKRGVPVIEDAAQAIGAEYRNGKRAGTMGLAGCLSFFPTKNLGGFGDGGAVLVNDAALDGKLRVLRDHGSSPKYYYKMIGGNFRLDAIQAAILDVKLAHLDAWTKRRQENAARYDSLFSAGGLPEKAGVVLPQAVYRDSGVKHFHIYNQYVIRVPKRDALREHLREAGIGTEIYYPVPFHLQECFRNLGYKKGAFPESERAANETLALPIFPELTAEQQEIVVGEVKRFYGK